jgi:hypothetical protein
MGKENNFCVFERLETQYKCKFCEAVVEKPAYRICPVRDNQHSEDVLKTYGQTKGRKNKFLCEKCGFKYKAAKVKEIPHKCEDYICQWEPLGVEYKCKNCGIVLSEQEFRACSEKTGLQGVGDFIAKALKLIGKSQKEGCGCGDKQKKMNDILPF